MTKTIGCGIAVVALLVVAGMIGANVERVSGILTKLQEDKVLRREGEYLLITDARGFEKSLEYEKDWA